MKKLHRGWLILFLILLVVLACLGFGRFSFGAILPFMKSGLALNYQETGYLASSIFLGYLITVFLAGHLVIRFKAKNVIITSLFCIGLGMVLAANATSFLMAYLGCLIIGLGSGGAYVPSLGLLGQWFSPKRSGMAMGIAMAGSGLGIVFSGFAVPAIISETGSDGWRTSWYLLAGLVIIVACINVLFLKNRPEDVNLKPIGDIPALKETKVQPQQGNESSGVVYRNKTLWFIGIIYLSWGMSYLVFSTFLVDYLIADVGFVETQAGHLFAVAGVSSIASGFIWGSLSDRLGRMPTLSIVLLLQFFLLLALSFTASGVVIFLISLVYGITLWAVPTIINASVSDYIQPKYIPVAMGFVTVFFSSGQFLSPVIIGNLINYTNSYFSAFLFSSMAALLGGLGCIKLSYNNRTVIEKSIPAVHDKIGNT